MILYTREFFQQGKRRLTPGGIFQLWIPYQESVSDFKTHLRTFRSEFGRVSIFFGPGGNGVYIIGSAAPLSLDDSQAQAVIGTPAAAADLSQAPDFKPLSTSQWVAELRRALWLKDGQVDAYAGPGPLITDDHPSSEYFFLRDLTSAAHPTISEDVLRGGTSSTGGRTSTKPTNVP